MKRLVSSRRTLALWSVGPPKSGRLFAPRCAHIPYIYTTHWGASRQNGGRTDRVGTADRGGGLIHPWRCGHPSRAALSIRVSRVWKPVGVAVGITPVARWATM